MNAGERVGFSTASMTTVIAVVFAGCCGVSGPGPQPLWIRERYSVVGGNHRDYGAECQDRLSWRRKELSKQCLFEQVYSPEQHDDRAECRFEAAGAAVRL